MRTLTVSQHDELNKIRRLTQAAGMVVFGSVSLDPLERAALNAIEALVSSRMAALVDESIEHDDAECAAADARPKRKAPAANTNPKLAALRAKPKSPAARTKRKGK